MLLVRNAKHLLLLFAMTLSQAGKYDVFIYLLGYNICKRNVPKQRQHTELTITLKSLKLFDFDIPTCSIVAQSIASEFFNTESDDVNSY